jgi:competence protein ComEA
VNLNSAESSELQTLPGIGPAKADAIIKHRETNGPFKSIEDLKEISGIGDKTFEKLKDLISVK